MDFLNVFILVAKRVKFYLSQKEIELKLKLILLSNELLQFKSTRKKYTY